MRTALAGPVVLLASRIRSEEKAIIDALRRRGVPAEQVDSRRLSWTAGGPPPMWSLALNREISGTRARYAALALEACGITVVNPAAAIETCGDKWLTSLALQRAGVATPRTTLALTPDAAREEIEALGYPVVVKPLSSSWGRRVALLRDADAAEAVLEHCAALPSPQAHVIYIQEWVEKPGRDIRVVVVSGAPLAAAYRQSAHWRTNVARGAESRPCPVEPELGRLAVAAVRAVGADIAGVDIAETPDGRLLVLEVNSGVEFDGLQAAHGGRVDVAGAIADLVVGRAANRLEAAVR